MLKNDNKVFFDSNCRALIFGSSGAIGSAIVRNLKLKVGDENVTTISRSKDRLDFLDPKGIDFIASKQEGKFRLILDATGALEINNYGPEKSLSALEPKAMMNQFAVNAVGPALLMKHFMHLLSRTNKSVFVTLSARVGSIEDNRLGGWISYRASKAALNQIVKTASIEAARRNPESLFIGIHPGTVSSKLSEKYLANHSFVQPQEAAEKILQVIEEKDYHDNGGFFAYDGTRIPY